jgi:hypothetical protein
VVVSSAGRRRLILIRGTKVFHASRKQVVLNQVAQQFNASWVDTFAFSAHRKEESVCCLEILEINTTNDHHFIPHNQRSALVAHQTKIHHNMLASHLSKSRSLLS